MDNILSILSSVSEPRRGNRLTYPLDYLMLIMFSGILSGYLTCEDFELYAQLYEGKLKEVYNHYFKRELRRYTPSHDTFCYVLRRLDPDAFKGAFKEWVMNLFDIKNEHIAIDGKTMRGIKKLNPQAECHAVTAYLPSLRASIDEVFISKKSNEINAIKDLLQLIDIKDSVVTIDAIGTQTEIVDMITEKEGDYILNVKSNQPGTLLEIEELFVPYYKQEISKISETDCGHGRIEKRTVESIINPLKLSDKECYISLPRWRNLKSVHKVTRERMEKKDCDKGGSKEVTYYISSLENQEDVATLIRRHWAVENNLHYVLDVFFGEDKSTIRMDNAAKNVNIIYKIALFFLERLKAKTGKTFNALKKTISVKGPEFILSSDFF